MTRPPDVSIIIPAHNEQSVIERSLRALFDGIEPARLDVVVVCNGCRDATADRARATGLPIRVLEIAEPSKPAALRLGDRVAVGYPRLYLDADVVLPGSSALAVAARLRAGALAARPPLRYDASRSSAAVRSYYRARAAMPAVLGSLWGAGVCGLSGAGRGRFDEFPDLTSDDLWLDRQFAPGEVEIVDCPPVIVAVPRRARDLFHTLKRTYRGKAEHQPSDGGPDARAQDVTRGALQDLRRHALTGIAGARDAGTYVGFAAGARLAAALAGGASAGWERDESSRTA